MKISFNTHKQAMACLACGLAGIVPESHFPLESGLWDEPCTNCGQHMVWVTEVLPKTVEDKKECSNPSA